MSGISNRIFELIEIKEISYGDLSKLTKIPKSALQRYATGETDNIPVSRFFNIAAALGVTPQYLFESDEQSDTEDFQAPPETKITVGERIRRRRKEIGMSAEKLASLIGVSAATAYRYENGDIEKVPGSLLEPIAAALRTTPQYLMGWEQPDEPLPQNIFPMPKTHAIPRLGSIACGTPILADANIDGYDDVPEYVKADFTLVCKGDSMINARIFDGDVVYIRKQPTVENGEIAAVLVEGEATLKRVRLYNDHVSLEAENPMFPPIVRWGEDMNTINIIGKAVAFTSTIRKT